MKLAITQAQVAFYYAKIIGNFSGEVNGTVRSAWKCSGLSGPSPEVVFFDGSFWSDRNLLFLLFQILISSPTLLSSNQNSGQNANKSL